MSDETGSHVEPLPIALTPGEPAGIGPDIVLRLALEPLPAPVIAVADPDLLRRRAEQLRLPVAITATSPEDTGRAHRPGELPVLPVPLAVPVRCGHLDPANAPYVLETLRRATEACLAGACTALVTGPVHKGVINDAGIAFSGHTEFLQELTGAPQVVMMLATGALRVALATTHLPLAAVPAAITRPRLRAVLQVLDQGLRRWFGLPRPRVLVCGLNPHAGEGGHLGREEIEVIAPVLEELRAAGFDLVGPLPADTLFTPRQLEHADAVLAMYHDQGLPVLKHVGFGRAVNITLGLPIIRTSVDHGTALELAGTGRADPGSLRAALDAALTMSRHAEG